MRYVMGIDPGLSGALAFKPIDMPFRVETRLLPRYDDRPLLCAPSLFSLLGAINQDGRIVVVAVEEPFAFRIENPMNTLTIGRNHGIILCCLELLGIPYFSVPPHAWQREICLGIPAQLEQKQRALKASERLYPTISFVPTAKSVKPHDGLVDAALIAEFARLYFLGELKTVEATAKERKCVSPISSRSKSKPNANELKSSKKRSRFSGKKIPISATG